MQQENNMKLSIVISVLNQLDMSKVCFNEIEKNTSIGDNEFIIIDNGSDIPIQQIDFPCAKIIRNEINIGVYPTFKQGMEISTGDVVAFFHSDLIIWEKDWDKRVMKEFEMHNIGMVGFIGSNEIDASGGRGMGTTSNFQGKQLDKWKGSPWNVHGKHLIDSVEGAVIDGCSMILRRDAWNKIGYREDFPPHHFYDRLLSCQIIEANYKIYIVGIECDHISGQTVNQEKGYQMMAWEWLRKRYGEISFHPFAVGRVFDEKYNYDAIIYQLAELLWLSEYKETKHLVPIKI